MSTYFALNAPLGSIKSRGKLLGMPSRRNFIFFTCCLPLFYLFSCKRKYKRPAEQLDLGEPRNLLAPQQYLKHASILLFKDDRGFSALSMRCSYDGCDLTDGDQALTCSCCSSRYKLNGQVTRGPAAENLSFYEINFQEGHLFANSAKTVNQNYRFLSKELDELIKSLKFAPGETPSSVAIPDPLLGRDSTDYKNKGILPDDTYEMSDFQKGR
ncbi:Rieske 2Fe-2S domain-containing protein [bacterium]|nr:Rieske 2Fe-2S domain-containing protein [bacterium]